MLKEEKKKEAEEKIDITKSYQNKSAIHLQLVFCNKNNSSTILRHKSVDRQNATPCQRKNIIKTV